MMIYFEVQAKRQNDCWSCKSQYILSKDFSQTFLHKFEFSRQITRITNENYGFTRIHKNQRHAGSSRDILRKTKTSKGTSVWQEEFMAYDISTWIFYEILGLGSFAIIEMDAWKCDIRYSCRLESCVLQIYKLQYCWDVMNG